MSPIPIELRQVVCIKPESSDIAAAAQTGLPKMDMQSTTILFK